jgi:uncharacterized RDD family membrane protein YckC
MAEFRPAGWRPRFWAWVIDVLIISILWYMCLIATKTGAASIAGVLSLLAMLFVYWTLLEGYRGQSVGKMMLSLVVVGTAGERIGFMDAAVESFGKAFLLPLDCLLGWIGIAGKGQRFSHRLSNTVVVSAEECIQCGLD